MSKKKTELTEEQKAAKAAKKAAAKEILTNVGYATMTVATSFGLGYCGTTAYLETKKDTPDTKKIAANGILAGISGILTLSCGMRWLSYAQEKAEREAAIITNAKLDALCEKENISEEVITEKVMAYKK